MELLLNLAWLLLVLPAYWLWRGSSTADRKFQPYHRLLVLACTLVILFPVVSATDDLHAMRAEIEESPTSKRSCHAGGEKISADNAHFQPALTLCTNFTMTTEWGWYRPPLSSVFAAAADVVSSRGRAPPASPID